MHSEQVKHVHAPAMQPQSIPANPPQRLSNLAPTLKPTSHQTSANQENRILVNASPPLKSALPSTVSTTTATRQELWTSASSLFQTTTTATKPNEPTTHASDHRLSPAFQMPQQASSGSLGQNRGQQYHGSLAPRSSTVRSSPRRVNQPYKRTSPYE